MTSQHSGPRSEKVGRGRSAATIILIGAAVRELTTRHPQTLRQLYYRLVSGGDLGKTEPDYARLKRIVKTAREEGIIPWDWLVDHTRAVFQPRTWDGIEDLLVDSAQLYRRDLMRQQGVAVQLWAESDSVGSIIAPVADRYCIPTFIRPRLRFPRVSLVRGPGLRRRPRWRQGCRDPARRRPRPIGRRHLPRRGGNPPPVRAGD